MLKKLWCILSLLFLCTYAQEKNNHFSIKYFIDKDSSYDINQLESVEFLDFDTTFPGVQKTKFWYKTTIHNSLSKLFFTLNTVSISDFKVYQLQNNTYKKIYEYTQKRNKHLVVPFDLSAGNQFVFEVFFRKSIYFPISIETKESLAPQKTNHWIICGGYYGFVGVVLFINFFFYFQTKQKFFLLYNWLAFSIAMILFELDNFMFVIFGNVDWIKYVDVCLHTMLMFALIYFTTSALELKKYMPKYIYFGYAIAILNSIPYIIYLVTDSLTWYSIGETFNAIGMISYWIPSLYLFRKLIYARFMLVGYTVILISDIIYVLPSEFGLIDLGFTPAMFKIGSVIEMLVFLYAISYRYKISLNEKNDIQQNLHLIENQLNHIKKQQNEEYDQIAISYNLTPREIQVFEGILKGYSNKKIAMELYVSESTIKYHCKTLYEKLQVKNRSNLIAKFSNTILIS